MISRSRSDSRTDPSGARDGTEERETRRSKINVTTRRGSRRAAKKTVYFGGSKRVGYRLTVVNEPGEKSGSTVSKPSPRVRPTRVSTARNTTTERCARFTTT